jgi:hypothetical protein
MKKWEIISLVVVVLLLGLVLLVLSNRPGGVVYSTVPGDWVDDGGIIDATKVTKGESYDDNDQYGQQYQFGPYQTVFNYEGWYNGRYFFRSIADVNGNLIMKIGPDLNPDDGVIEGYMVEELNDDGHVIYIFVDSDWKKFLGDSVVQWGKTYSNERKLDFSNEVKPGIFMDSVVDEDSRFSNGYTLHQGGIYVGEIDGEKSTVMSLS